MVAAQDFVLVLVVVLVLEGARLGCSVWRRIRGQALRVFVPEGRNDRSQAIYCLECATQRTRPVGNGMTKSDASLRNNKPP